MIKIELAKAYSIDHSLPGETAQYLSGNATAEAAQGNELGFRIAPNPREEETQIIRVWL